MTLTIHRRYKDINIDVDTNIAINIDIDIDSSNKQYIGEYI